MYIFECCLEIFEGVKSNPSSSIFWMNVLYFSSSNSRRLTCTICSQNSSNVENHHLNYICQSCAHYDDTIFKNWTFKAVQDKTCYVYAIFYVKAAWQQRVIIPIITENIIYIRKISRHGLLWYCTLLRIVQNSNKAKTFLVQIQKTRNRHLRCAW